MNLTRFAIDNRVIVLAVTAVLLLYGTSTFLTMPRREDPEITIRAAVVVTQWPGASAEKVEELVTDPLEKAIDQIDEVDKITSKSRTGQSIITVELDETLQTIDQVWDDVRYKVSEAAGRLPDGCQSPVVNTEFGDVAAVIYALVQTPSPGRTQIDRPYDWRELERLAEKVVDDFKTVESVAKVNIEGAQEEVIYIDLDAEWAKVEMTTADLRNILQARNVVAAGGEINRDGTRFSVQPSGEFTAVDQIGEVLVARQDGTVPVRMRDLPFSGMGDDDSTNGVRVHRGFADPQRTLFHLTAPGRPTNNCLLLSVTMKSGRNIVDTGEELSQHVDRLTHEVLPPDIELVRINDLPRQVGDLISGFVDNLAQAILIVLGVALFMMGWRPAIIMAAAVPLCMLAAILVVSMLGVELEQFSIASLIIALGMLVDNAIVVSDNALRGMAQRADGSLPDRRMATINGAWSLAVPILTSTATTVAAFLPMLTIVGSVGEYTRSLPIVVATTLAVSYFVAMTVTPIMCLWLLRPVLATTAPQVSFWVRLWRLVPRRKQPAAAPRHATPRAPRPGAVELGLTWCLRNRTLTLGLAGAAVIGSLLLVPAIGSQFFPGGVRDQFFVHVWLPEGSSITATTATCERIERLLVETSPTDVDGATVERLAAAVSFIGTGGPRINLTTNPQQTLPNYAFILVNTTDASLSRDWASELKRATDLLPGARIDVSPFMLGPYIENPIEFRLYGENATLLRGEAERFVGEFRRTPGVQNPFHDWLNSGYSVRIDVDEEAANLAGVSNAAIADTMSTLISGGQLTTFREGDHQVRVILRMRPERRTALLDAPDIVYVDGQAGKVPLDAVADVTATWQPAVIARRNNVRCITVGSKVAAGFLANEVGSRLEPRLREAMRDLPPGYRLEQGGEKEQTTQSQQKLLSAFTLSFFLILLVLIAQYGSVLKPLVILSTVPLALIGALLGLYVSGWPLGFMPSLGIISLAGVVINNAIILVDFIESNVREGAHLEEALARASSQRMQPILLTTLTTVGGLLPLALLGGPMWAGMAWAMILGLALSTGLTLFVVPTIYAVFAQRLGMRVT